MIAFFLRPLLSVRALTFFDGGFSLSFGLGLAVSFLFSWVFSAVGFFRFDTVPCIAVFLILTIVVNLLSFRHKLYFRWTKEELSRFLLGAALFFALFLLALYAKGFRGSIDSQTEQFMDYGFMQAMYRQKEARPYDIWFSGQRLNYYYLGQAASVYLCRLSFDAPEYGYNLMLVTIFAGLFMMVFSLCEAVISALVTYSPGSYIIRKRTGILGALLGALATACGANGHYVIYGIFFPFLERVTGKELVKDFWFPDSTTFIGGFEGSLDHGKHEYPAYTVILGDLHAHVVNMLFTLPLIALLFDYAAFTAKEELGRKGNIKEEKGGAGPLKKKSVPGFLTGLLTEEDDFSQVMRAMNKEAYLKLREQEEQQEASNESAEAVTAVEAMPDQTQEETRVMERIPMGKEALAWDRPLILHYILLGILLGLYCGVNYWDFPIYFIVSGAVILFCDLKRFGVRPAVFGYVLAKGGVILLISQLAILPFTRTFEKISSELGICDRHSRISELLLVWGFKFYVVAVLLIFLFLQYKKRKTLGAVELALAAVAMCAIGLILSPEVVYIKDIYGDDYQRYNTMFKLTYQGFILFGIITGIAAAVFLGGRRLLRLQGALLIVATLLSSTYIIKSAGMWFGNLLMPSQRTGISATGFMRRGENEYGLEWGAIEYLNGLPEERLNIVETAGTSYQPDDKLSVFTGTSTVIGWFVHEWLWRSNSEIVSYRTGEVRSFYESGDPVYCLDFLKRYNIDYVYLGPREYNYYAIRTDGFNEYCEVVWDDQGYALLRVNKALTGAGS